MFAQVVGRVKFHLFDPKIRDILLPFDHFALGGGEWVKYHPLIDNKMENYFLVPKT